MTGKRWLALGVAAAVFFVSTIVSFASSLIFSDFRKVLGENVVGGDVFEEVIETGLPNQKIALLEVDGIIQDTGAPSLFSPVGYQHREFMKQLNHVKDDRNVKAIVLRVNTPGGGTNESAEIYHKLVQIKEETEKPIYVSMGSMAASGGYYISAPADKIFASPETITGSIGVIMQGINVAELTEKLGIDFPTIKSGPYKDIMSQYRDMTNEEQEILDSMVQSSYDEFVRIIAEGRNMSEVRVRELADGRIYDGRQAKEVGLIDEFGYQEDVIAQIKEDFDLKDAQVVRYSPSVGFGSLLGVMTQRFAGKETELQGITELLTQPNAPRLMYLYSR